MKVMQASSAGFCYGVNRAVDLVEQAARGGKPTVTYGPIAHNRHLVAHFEALGIRAVSAPEEVPDGATVVIRSHGVPRAVYEALLARPV